VKELLEQVSEQAHKIENAKLCAVGTRNLVSAEVEMRPRILQDQQNIISDKQDQLQVTIFILFHGNNIIIYIAIN
jgi:intraflagellar transport protein 20